MPKRYLVYFACTLLGLCWSGFFLYVAYRRLLRFGDLVFAASPFYPGELAALMATPGPMVDWESPLWLAGAPLALVLLWRVLRRVGRRPTSWRA